MYGGSHNARIKLLKDINSSETTVLFVLAAAIIIFGFYPDPLMDTVNTSVNDLLDNYEKDLIYHLSANK